MSSLFTSIFLPSFSCLWLFLFFPHHDSLVAPYIQLSCSRSIIGFCGFPKVFSLCTIISPHGASSTCWTLLRLCYLYQIVYHMNSVFSILPLLLWCSFLILILSWTPYYHPHSWSSRIFWWKIMLLPQGYMLSAFCGCNTYCYCCSFCFPLFSSLSWPCIYCTSLVPHIPLFTHILRWHYTRFYQNYCFCCGSSIFLFVPAFEFLCRLYSFLKDPCHRLTSPVCGI